jgi:hypothetical protein
MVMAQTPRFRFRRPGDPLEPRFVTAMLPQLPQSRRQTSAPGTPVTTI